MGNFFSSPAGLIDPAGIYYNQIDKSMKKDRSQENADKQREADYNAQMTSIGMNELGQYKYIQSGYTDSSGLTPEQKKQLDDERSAMQTGIDRKTAAETAQMRQGMAERGITESTTALHGQAAVEQDRIAMQEQATQIAEQPHWDAFVKATGIAEQSSQILASMNDADRKQAMEIYSSTMSIMGKAAGANSGSKSTVNEYSAASDGTSYVPDNVSRADYYGYGSQAGNQ